MNVYFEEKETKHNLAEWHRSKNGYEFDFYSDTWEIDGSIKINFRRFRIADKETAFGFRQALCRYAEELSASTTNNVFGRFEGFVHFTGAKTVNTIDLANYRASLKSDDEYKLGVIKGFLLAWQEWGFKGVDVSVAKFLKELTLRGNVKGKAVKGACPYSGPLTHNELGALIVWASNAFNTSTISLKEFAFFMTLVMTGRRSVQTRSLRSKDLVVREDSEGHDYVINYPRAKVRGGKFRGDFTPLTINEDLFLILSNQKNESIRLIEKELGQKLPPKLQDQIPVFLEATRLKNLNGIKGFETRLKATPDYFHMTASSSSSLLRKLSVLNTARSERTGEFIQFNAGRFRMTKGTNLARRGIRGVALAAALDHTDTQNIGVYVENTEEVAEQVNAIMAPVLAALAQAFAGKLIRSERDAIRANDPNSRIKNGRANNIGNCGTHSFCVAGYRSCYTCVSFQPWLEAPHEEVLEEIVAERKRQIDLGISPYVIQATDRLVLAVQQVILLCQEEKEKGV